MVTNGEAKMALMACRRLLDREFPNCAAVLASYIDGHVAASLLTELSAADEREAYLAEHPEKRTVYDRPTPPDPLVAARERLGAYLASESGRSWDWWTGQAGQVVVDLWPNRGTDMDRIAGEGPGLAAAILDALEKANT